MATPATAATLVVPESVPPAGFVSSARVTTPVKDGTVFPCASRATICNAGVMLAPAAVPLGCTVKASWVGAPGVMPKVALVALDRPLAVAVSA